VQLHLAAQRAERAGTHSQHLAQPRPQAPPQTGRGLSRLQRQLSRCVFTPPTERQVSKSDW
jgi:hypothetical protein